MVSNSEFAKQNEHMRLHEDHVRQHMVHSRLHADHMREHESIREDRIQLYKNDRFQMWMGGLIIVLLLIHLTLTIWEIFT